MARKKQEVDGGFRVQVVDGDVGVIEAYDAGPGERFGGVGICSQAIAAGEGCECRGVTASL